MNSSIVYIVYGVSGSGKTTIGKKLAEKLNIPFYDADDFHPENNIKKMSDGFPLNDDDRDPWLQRLATLVKDSHRDQGAVLACSALKKKYRRILQSTNSEYIQWIFLDGDFELIEKRMKFRENHFFKKEMLVSQFEVLEKPDNGIIVDINNITDDILGEIITKLNMNKSQLGLIGLGVMGKSLAKNLISKNFTLSVYNRHVDNYEVDIAKNFVSEQSKNDTILGFDNLNSFVQSLQQPRIIMLMVNAGKPVDEVITDLMPLLSENDCIIDGGNSHYKFTEDRSQSLAKAGIHFLGVGISGGEEGALNGPSIMPGGSRDAYERSGKILEAIAAKDKENKPCCALIGPEGSGHYVKMVHNGIEYAEMQLLAETYHSLRFYAKKSPDQIANILHNWKSNGLDSYLLEITIDILRKKEGEDFLVDKILDKAGQKGTGGWSTVASLELGMPLSTISESVMARNLSGMKSKRVIASEMYQLAGSQISEDDPTFIENLKKAFYAARIINHHIGFELLKEASDEYGWGLNLSEISRIWTNGCIIKSNLMENIWNLFAVDHTVSLLLFPEIVTILKSDIEALTDTVATVLKAGYALPVFSAAAYYFLMYTSSQSSANIIQAQRDYFGAHTYQRVDKPIDEYFHTNWKY
ncbi:decarboxylating NADP(+)-dependent phosphogluconate dehydrogenase [Aquimarina sp. SS2-1]|uniref:decarboxylating NADP(+)-dependent phosphogluconate dehydrogenase n=1 Tax=Aquimarina besae TaxID=3342247 RepID=UPI0036718AED